MGVVDAFDEDLADFSAMTDGDGDGSLAISDAVHHTFIEVDELGSETAGVMYMNIDCCNCIVEDFNANHPFIFYIKNNKFGNIIFMG